MTTKRRNKVKKAPFVGRRFELNELELLTRKKMASLVVIQGRRRIGKSRLIKEFGKNKNLCIISGIPLTPETTAQSQREEFARQLNEQFLIPGLKAEDWGDLFTALFKEVQQKKVIILFDEISWMGSKDPDFLGKLKNAWDLQFSQNSQLILILCGSVSSWIDKNILNNTAFLGRVSSTISLKELSAAESYLLLKMLGCRYSQYDVFKLLSVMGGIPKYLEEVQYSLTAEDNIKRLCFHKSGFLYNEFDKIFSDLFSKRNLIYKKIIYAIFNGAVEFNDICKTVEMAKSGLVSEYLDDLIKAGFVSRDYTWHLKTGEVSRLSQYRISDNYIRFYLKCIEKNSAKIEKNHFQVASLSQLPGWDILMGYQFENLVLNNRDFILKKLNLRHEDIISDNPFFQRKTEKNAGCQIDYLIQNKYNSLFLCEIKFSRQEIKGVVMDEVQRKIESITKPKGFSCFPILIHVNGVSDVIYERDFFSEIIDFCELLTDT